MKRSLHNLTAATSCWLILMGLVDLGQAAFAAETNSTSGVDFKSFQIIADRNIFDPNRRPGRPFNPQPIVRPPQTESFTLVGTMSSPQGTFAFFNGTSSDFRKTAKPGDVIAGYKVAEIAHDYVKLGAASNQTIKLPMLTQMRRQEGGPWSIGPRGDSSEAPAPATATPASTETKPADFSAKSGAISDVMKRLMEKREKE